MINCYDYLLSYLTEITQKRKVSGRNVVFLAKMASKKIEKLLLLWYDDKIYCYAERIGMF